MPCADRGKQGIGDNEKQAANPVLNCFAPGVAVGAAELGIVFKNIHDVVSSPSTCNVPLAQDCQQGPCQRDENSFGRAAHMLVPGKLAALDAQDVRVFE